MSDLLAEAEAEQEREEARERAKDVAAAAEGFGREKYKGNNTTSNKSLEDRNQASRRLLGLKGFLVTSFKGEINCVDDLILSFSRI